MQVKKLTPGEITEVVNKIRKRYDEYSYKFFKSRSLKIAFEERYLNALEESVDVSNFLLAEIGAIDELIKREEEKVASGSVRSSGGDSMSFSDKADKIIEENRKKILKYPEIRFHKDTSEEIRHLLGALNNLEQKYWENLILILKDTAYSRNSMTIINLESKLRYLGSIGKDRISSGLSRYLYHLNLFPRDYHAIDREEKDYILECAFFLHDLYDILLRVATNYPELNEQSRESLKEIMAYVSGVIENFRLKDLKRRK